MSADVLLGLEVMKLGGPADNSPWQMTVDVWDGREEKILRYQLVGRWRSGTEGPWNRTLDDLARVQAGPSEERDRIAAELDRLDREAAAKIAPIMDELFRAQAVALHGVEVLELLDADG